MKSLIKNPSAYLPIALSLIVLAVMLFHIATVGVPQREPDEGTAAHLFQIWLILEIIMIGLFTVTWLPQKPKQALLVLSLQLAAVIAACTPVFLLNL